VSQANPKRAHALEVLKRLKRAMPEPRCELDHQDAWQLLVATILSAQSTDKMVNQVTPKLFARYATPAALGAAEQADVETLVKSTGFFRNKAKAIRAASQLLVERHAGSVPRTLDEMVALPGVARKTANVVLGTAYRIASGMTVDTHVGRVARRLRLSKQDDPIKVESDLCALFPKSSWIDMGHRLVLHGRYVCLARKPRCAECPLAEICPAAEASASDRWTARAERERSYVESRGQHVAAPAADASQSQS
jgi:endonuclease III